MLNYLSVSFVHKDNFISKLKDIFKDNDDFGDLELLVPGQINLFLSLLKEQIWFVIEYPYVDRHYRDTYYTFHSSKFRKIGRNCLRVHLFEKEVTENDLLNRDVDVNGIYRGFFVIRPLMHHILGRSLISPTALKNDKFVCCLMEGRVSLLGNNLAIKGFPHIAQDMETHTCAESALWSYIEYFGSKHPQYKPLLPSKIIKTLLDSTEHRILPSVGLTERELAKCLNDNGFQCLTYENTGSSPASIGQFFQLLKIYVESGIPLLLYLQDKENAHAVLVIGHETDVSIYDTEKYFAGRKEPWVDVSFIDKKMVFIDDNMPPYQMADLSRPTIHYDPNMQSMKIRAFIVSLPAHVFLVAEKVYDLMERIFNNNDFGLSTLNGEWVTRLLLSGSKSFKNFLMNADKKMPKELADPLLTVALPKFIWICELYKKDDFKPGGHCSGLLIIDATSDGKSFYSILFFAVENILYEPDEGGRTFIKHDDIVPFRMETYKNNLEGG